jgi:dimeric dUTPase (all-alpha-NTP-PPase superfamily)
MNKLVLDDLYALQHALDLEIQARHGVTYASTEKERFLALFVEFGEFANATRCFKFWSLKAPAPKDVILDEYADGLHFFLSLGIPLGVSHLEHSFAPKDKSLTESLLEVYGLAFALESHYDEAHYREAFGAYLDILPLLGYTGEEAREAYRKKLDVNKQRQAERY